MCYFVRRFLVYFTVGTMAEIMEQIETLIFKCSGHKKNASKFWMNFGARVFHNCLAIFRFFAKKVHHFSFSCHHTLVAYNGILGLSIDFSQLNLAAFLLMKQNWEGKDSWGGDV